MKLDKSPLSMVSMMKQLENMEMQILGNTVLRSLTTLVLELLLKERSSVFMEVYLLKSKLLIKSDLLTEEWKFLMRDHSVI